MTTLETPRVLENVWKSVLAWGVLTLILGVVILVWPGISIEVAAVLFGAYLIVSGLAQVMFAFALDVPGGERVLLLISGALSLVLGVLAFRHLGEGYAILLLAIWIGVSFIFQGVAESTLAITLKELPGRGWHIFLGVLSVIAGIGRDCLAVRFHRPAGDRDGRVACRHRNVRDRLGAAGPQGNQHY